MPDSKPVKMSITEALAFALESGTNPVSGVGLDLFKLPTGYKGNFVDDLYAALLKTDVVEPFDSIAVLNSRNRLKSHWKAAGDIDMARHIKRHVLPKPGGKKELIHVVERLRAQPHKTRAQGACFTQG